MKKPNTFIRELNLKFSRKLKVVEDFGKRFVIDSNANSIVFTSELTDSTVFGLSITKSKGKYVVYRWINDWKDEIESSFVTSKDSLIEKLINDRVGYTDSCTVRDKHMNSLKWVKLPERDIDEIDSNEIDWGELPDTFEPLEAIPAEISINL